MRRLNVTNKQIAEAVEKMGTVKEAAKVLGIQRETVRKALRGLRKEKSELRDTEEMCSCCGSAPRHPGFRFLCWECYRRAGGGMDGGAGIQSTNSLNQLWPNDGYIRQI